MVAHRLSTVLTAHQICYIDGGRATEAGSPAQLLGLPEGAFASMFQKQATVRPPASQLPKLIFQPPLDPL